MSTKDSAGNESSGKTGEAKDNISTDEIEQFPLEDLEWESDDFQVMPSVSETEREPLKNKIEEEGFGKDHPIIVDENGNVIDGHTRCEICDELGIDLVWISRQESLTHKEKIKAAYKENTARRNLGNGQKREAVKTFYVNHYDGESYRDIADLVGVSRGTVSNAKSELTEVEEGIFAKPAVSKLDTPEDDSDDFDDISVIDGREEVEREGTSIGGHGGTSSGKTSTPDPGENSLDFETIEPVDLTEEGLEKAKDKTAPIEKQQKKFQESDNPRARKGILMMEWVNFESALSEIQDLSCPLCGSSPEGSEFQCCNISIAEAKEIAEKKYENKKSMNPEFEGLDYEDSPFSEENVSRGEDIVEILSQVEKKFGEVSDDDPTLQRAVGAYMTIEMVQEHLVCTCDKDKDPQLSLTCCGKTVEDAMEDVKEKYREEVLEPAGKDVESISKEF